MKQFNIHTSLGSASKNFSPYGINTSLSKEEALNNAIKAARALYKKNEDETRKKTIPNGPIALGSFPEQEQEIPESSKKVFDKLEQVPKIKKKHVSFKTDEEIKASLEKANEINRKLSSKFNEESSTEEILSSVLNDIF